MENINYQLSRNSEIPTEFLILFIFFAVWELYWKGRALWKSAQKKEKGWFIAILVLNTLGILPIIYLAFYSKK